MDKPDNRPAVALPGDEAGGGEAQAPAGDWTAELERLRVLGDTAGMLTLLDGHSSELDGENSILYLSPAHRRLPPRGRRCPGGTSSYGNARVGPCPL